MHKYGLKLWSINKNYVKEAEKLFKASVYQFIELYAVPGSFDEHISIWKDLDIPFVIHASHYPEGMNLAKKENLDRNLALMTEAQGFADTLKAKHIIVHAGTDGDTEETISQIKAIKDERIQIENKPYKSLYKGLTSNGSAPDEIKRIIIKAKVGFCLDMGHAICSANSHKKDPLQYLKEFIELKPNLFHFSDGVYTTELDSHPHFGQGNYPLQDIVKLIPDNSSIVIETEKGSKTDLDDFIRDVEYLRHIL